MDKHLKEKFRKRAQAIAKHKKNPKFLRVLGKFKKLGLLDVPGIPAYGGPVDLNDVLWAGQFEPRILTVLPGLLYSRPKSLRVYQMPEDLQKVLGELKRGKPQANFRNIPPNEYARWITKPKGILKTFRLTPGDLRLIESLKKRLSLKTEIDVIRTALKQLNK